MKNGFLKINFGKKGQGESEDSLSIFILLLCLVALFSPILFFGRSLYYSDFAFITYPVKSFLAQTFQVREHDRQELDDDGGADVGHDP